MNRPVLQLLRLSKSLAIRSLSILCAAAVSGCTTMSVPMLKVRGVESYELRQEQRGLIIAAHPITAQQEIDGILKVDLQEKGILPILVLAENRAASKSFILDRRRIETGKGNDSALTRAKRQEIGASPGGQAMAAIGAVLLVPTIILSAPLMFNGTKMVSDATVVEHNLGDKEFYSRTLDPGQQMWGVIYLALDEGPRRQGPYVLRLNPIDTETSETLSFTFSITTGR